jgi:hypothetical protein
MTTRIIGGIRINESDLTPLNDQDRKDLSLDFFYGAVTQMTFAESGLDVLRIWENARKYLKEVYLVSEYAEQDFHVFDMELARCSMQRAAQLKSYPQSKEIVVFNFGNEEKDNLAKIRDGKRKPQAENLFIEAVLAMESANDGKEVLMIHENYERELRALYYGSWVKNNDLPIWTYLMVKRLNRAAKRLERKRNGL